MSKQITERGISFSPAMIRRLLAKEKRMTRRLANPQPRVGKTGAGDVIDPAYFVWDSKSDGVIPISAECMYRLVRQCPYGVAGTRLYVKEGTWMWCDKRPDGVTKKGSPKFRYVPVGQHVRYCADGPKPTDRIDDNPLHMWKHKVARYMPKSAARLWREIEAIRLERLQAISEEDAIAEGVEPWGMSEADIANLQISDESPETKKFWKAMGPGQFSARANFQMLWDEINPKTWDSNPFVWVLSLRDVTP